MNRSKFSWIALPLMAMFAVAGNAFADENAIVSLQNQVEESNKNQNQQVGELKNQVNDLTKKLSMLESKLTTVEGNVSASKPAIVHEGHGTVQPGPLSDINVSGFIDTQWNNNFRQPKSNTNTGRVFDTTSGSFAVNAVEIDIEKAATEPGQAGFRVDIMHGNDANVVNGDGSDATSSVDLQQAYVQYIAPLSMFEGNSVLPSSVNIKAGRFVTLAGLEVIEAPQNWNISRSAMFGFGLPFTHTGVRTEFGLFNDFLDVYLGLNNGWDQAVDTNKFKTLETAVGWKLFDKIQFFHTLYWGAENATISSGTKRILITNTATIDITEKLSAMAETNWGHQNGGTSGDVNTNPDWAGFAGYLKYQMTPKFSMASRTEFFADKSVFRQAVDQRLFGQTFTAEYKLTDQLITRGELRFDKGNESDGFSGKSHQTTIGAQMIYVI